MRPWEKWKCRTSCSKSIQNFKMCDSKAGNHAWSPSEPGATSDCPWLTPIKSILALKLAVTKALGQSYSLYSRTFFCHRTPQTLICFSSICIPRRLGSLNPGPWAIRVNKWEVSEGFQKTPPSDWNVEKGTLKSRPRYMNYYNEAKKEWPFPLHLLFAKKVAYHIF